MSENPTSKSGGKLRIDHERNLIYIPGRDQPEELIAPIQQRVDADGTPYQHVVTATELLEAKEQHERCMSFIRDAMKAYWRCTQCQQVRPGTQLRVSGQMMELLGQMVKPGGARVNWDSIVEHLGGHLICKNAKCDAPCVPATRAEYLTAREAES